MIKALRLLKIIKWCFIMWPFWVEKNLEEYHLTKCPCSIPENLGPLAGSPNEQPVDWGQNQCLLPLRWPSCQVSPAKVLKDQCLGRAFHTLPGHELENPSHLPSISEGPWVSAGWGPLLHLLAHLARCRGSREGLQEPGSRNWGPEWPRGAELLDRPQWAAQRGRRKLCWLKPLSFGVLCYSD